MGTLAHPRQQTAHPWSRVGLASSRTTPGTEWTTQRRPVPQQLQLNCPHLTFSSGAELSHCEQSGNQSLFTNQLSSAPRQRGRRLGIRNGPPSIFHGCCFFCFWRRATRCICLRTAERENYGFWRSSPGHGCVVIPGNVILILSHKSACQEPKQPEHSEQCRACSQPTPHTLPSAHAGCWRLPTSYHVALTSACCVFYLES